MLYSPIPTAVSRPVSRPLSESLISLYMLSLFFDYVIELIHSERLLDGITIRRAAHSMTYLTD